MQTAVSDPLVGRVLEGRYEIRDRLARGGMSVVYVATDRRLEREVAVKVMTGDLSADPAFSDRFTREARAAARLSHLNVVSVYDQGDDDGHVYLVMELVRGITVRDLIGQRAPVPLAMAISVMEPVLAALSAAHRAGLVHRDVKPENVLISDDGLIKVADFGLARAAEADASSTRTGLMMGTVAYCSPEHITSGRADARSDVYAAAIMLFELLTGRVPFVGDSAVSVAYQHVHGRVPAPSSRVRGVPEQIDDLIIRATDPDPRVRPADAGAFLAELHDLRAELAVPITALPTNTTAGRARTPAAATSPLTDSAGATTVVSSGDAGGVGTHNTVALTGAQAATTALATATLLSPPTDRTGRRRATGGASHSQIDAVGSPVPDWRDRRRRRRWRTAVVLVVVLLLGALLGYGSWWYAAGRWAAVPNVAGQAASAAVSTLRAAGFPSQDAGTQVYSDTVPAGAVVRTEPAPGSRQVRGDRVMLVLSRGVERFQVPPTTGQRQADAVRALSAIPVSVRTVSASSDTVAAGTVLGTDPPAGAEVRRNAVVTVTVSSGPPVVAVPQVVGQPQDDAVAALRAAGFTVALANRQFSSTVAVGRVMSQDPSAATAVKFSTVTLLVSKGPDLVTVPTIANGTPVAQAQATLTAAGLQVTVDKKYGGLLGIVVGMNPAAGSVIPRGATVTLTSV